MKVVAIIPALNEEGAIGSVVRALPREQIQRIIVVDNGSDDGTAAAARAAGAEVVVEHHAGYGRACMAGVRAAPEADVLLFLDGDGSDFPEEAKSLLMPLYLGRADLVLGSREQGGDARAVLPRQARLGNKIAAALISRLDGVRISDLAPFKAVRAGALHRLRLREMTYGWTIELIVRAAQDGLVIAEVPVHYQKRLAGESKVSGTVKGSAKASARIVWTLARLHCARASPSGGTRLRRQAFLLLGGLLTASGLVAAGRRFRGGTRAGIK